MDAINLVEKRWAKVAMLRRLFQPAQHSRTRMACAIFTYPILSLNKTSRRLE